MTSVFSRNIGSDAYSFQSRPVSVQRRDKFQKNYPTNKPSSPIPFGNMMYDRRVIRGNTYSLRVLPATVQPDPIEIQRQQELRRRCLVRRRAQERLLSRTPEPVEGRHHAQVQTKIYLEEVSDRTEEADAETQTDAFLDRPKTPIFTPAKSGLDASTQIHDGDLFDFDIEVKPILEVLVGKTVEQSLIEVLEEEELANLRQQQLEFEEIRNAELVETQRLEEQERRHKEEKERRVKQAREVLKLERETAVKVAARAFAMNYLTDLIPTVFDTLRSYGYFFDPVEKDVEEGFIPELVNEVADSLERKILSRIVLDSLVREVVVKRWNKYSRARSAPAPKEKAKKKTSFADGLVS